MDRMTFDGDETTALTGESRMIVCGWCGRPTEWTALCDHCGHEEPAKPWEQRGDVPPRPTDERTAGRPRLDKSQIHERLRVARKELGADATNAQLAEHLGVDVKTVQRWQKVSG